MHSTNSSIEDIPSIKDGTFGPKVSVRELTTNYIILIMLFNIYSIADIVSSVACTSAVSIVG